MTTRERMMEFFRLPWRDVPMVWIDTETTGTRPGIDRAVEVAFARFERGKLVGTFESRVFPDMQIQPEATAIHGITNEMVADMPRIHGVFCIPEARELFCDAQPAAYNAGFDRQMVPPFLQDWDWPWVDCLTIVRDVDRYAKGKERHKLEATCKRWGIELNHAHSAINDAIAAGQLFYKLVERGKFNSRSGATLGDLLYAQRKIEADQWYRFHDWLSVQPPREETA
jgi:DNA polymerase III epsilon subunit-like protein